MARAEQGSRISFYALNAIPDKQFDFPLETACLREKLLSCDYFGFWNGIVWCRIEVHCGTTNRSVRGYYCNCTRECEWYQYIDLSRFGMVAKYFSSSRTIVTASRLMHMMYSDRVIHHAFLNIRACARVEKAAIGCMI